MYLHSFAGEVFNFASLQNAPASTKSEDFR